LVLKVSNPKGENEDRRSVRTSLRCCIMRS
jgi:hypothetical protein